MFKIDDIDDSIEKRNASNFDLFDRNDLFQDNFEDKQNFLDMFNSIFEEDKQNFMGMFNSIFEEDNQNFLDMFNSIFEEDQSFLEISNKIENEKSISQDMLEEERQNLRNNLDKKENEETIISDNFNKDENGKNFYNDKSNDNNEINKVLSNDSFISNINDKREDFSPKLGLDLSEGESKNDKVKENSNFFTEEISQIYENPVIKDKTIIRKKAIIGVNKSFSDSDNYDNKSMNRILDNCIFLKENKEYFCMSNDTFFNLNETQVKYWDSQNSFSYSSLNNDDSNDISRFQSKSVKLSPLENNTQLNNPFSLKKPNKSLNLTFSNQKRKRSKNKVINSLSNIENNFVNNSEVLENKYITKHFKVEREKNFGRKKKNSGKTGKHDKNSKDNMRTKVKSCSLKFLYEYFNKEIQKIDINDLNKSADWRLYEIKTVDIKTKVYNLKLLNQSLKSIFSSPLSGRSVKNKNHNKYLIDKIYQINQEKNSEKTKKVIKFFNMKYKEFFNYVKIIKDNKNVQEKIDGIDDDIKDMVKKFDVHLEEKLSKDNEDKVYNQKLIELMKNFPSNISNMQVKGEKRKDNNKINLKPENS